MSQRDCFVSEEEMYLYLDRELDSRRAVVLDDHLTACGDCAARYGIASTLKSILKNSCDSVKAPSWLKDKIVRGVGTEVSARGGGFWEYMRNQLGSRPLLPVGAAGFLIVVFLLVLFSNTGVRGTMPFVTQMVHEHYEYLEEPEKLGLFSSDPGEISQWLASNSDLLVTLPSDPSLPPPGGACLLEEEGETIGYVFFDLDGERVSLFMTRAGEKELFGPTRMDQKNISVYCGNCTGMNYAIWQANDLVCVLVGGIPQDVLVRIAGRII